VLRVDGAVGIGDGDEGNLSAQPRLAEQEAQQVVPLGARDDPDRAVEEVLLAAERMGEAARPVMALQDQDGPALLCQIGGKPQAANA
jgi:hypothetical protein